MGSGTSYFNMTLFRKNLARFWPIWGLYALIWVVLLPAGVLLRRDVLEIKDLKPGMELMGTVRNVIDFGAFVDIGVHEDGLVHISQMCDRYIKHPLEVVKVGEVVKVWVINVDLKKKRISLTMKKPKV